MDGGIYLHDGLLGATRHDDGLLLLKDDAPDGVGGLGELADEGAALDVPHFHAAVAAAGDDAGVVELQARDAVVVGGEPVDGLVVLQRPDAHAAVGAAGDEGVVPHLELADEGSVALEDGEAFARKVCVLTLRHKVVTGPWWMARRLRGVG